MQEAFIATLLAIARDHADVAILLSCDSDVDDDDLNNYQLWRVMKKQVKILREDMDGSEPNEPGKEVTLHDKAEMQGKEKMTPPVHHSTMGIAKEDSMRERTFHANPPIFSRRMTHDELLSLSRENRQGERSGQWPEFRSNFL